jgi:hypothetical protein
MMKDAIRIRALVSIDFVSFYSYGNGWPNDTHHRGRGE